MVQARGDGQDYCDSEWSTDCSFFVEPAVEELVDFTWWPDQPKQGQRVRFADLSTPLPRSLYWTLGDGSTSDGQHPTHVFDSAGSFDVMLDVVFDSGHAVEEKTITVSGTVQCGDDACEGVETAWSCPEDCALEPEETGRAGGTDHRPTVPAAAGGVEGVGGTLWMTFGKHR
jgi:PKD repeat protein